MRLTDAEIAVELEDDAPSWVAKAQCESCKVRGELGTCYSRVPFIHEVDDTVHLDAQARDEWRVNAIEAEYPYFVYCGYGSPCDGLFLLLTVEQKRKLPHKVCWACLTRALKGENVLAVEYLPHTGAWSFLLV